MKHEFTIIGQVPAKANSYMVIKRDNHSSLGKTKTLREYERSFYLQCPVRGLNLQGFFKVSIDVFFRSMSSDIDNCCKILLDCMQACEVYKNDNKCIDLHVRKFKDEKNPRCIITIEAIEI